MLLERHSEDVWRTLRAMVGAQAAEDCFQETFLAALRAYPRLRPDSNAARLAADDRPQQGDRPPAPRTRDERRRDRRGRPSDPRRRPTAAIWSAVAALPPRQRAAVALRYIGDLSHREIAAAIGCSEEASRRSLHDGLATLRRQL